MDQLKRAVQAYASRCADGNGLALTPVPGLRMKFLEAPSGYHHAVYRPIVCLILQGAKRMVVGSEVRVISAGQSVIVSAHVPVAARIVQASPDEPYLAMAVELEMALLRELSVQLGEMGGQDSAKARTLFAVDTEVAALDCAARLMQLLDRPEAIPLLRPGIMRELHYWLLSGQHGKDLRALADPDSHASRLGAAMAILRAEYRSRISVERLAGAAAMSLSAFHKHFKRMTSLTPGQYQKQLRLIEARRLMLEEGFSASSASFEVGYESVSQFTREYRRMFQAPPKRDARRIMSASREGEEQLATRAA